ncbi:hypothetical protein KUTeg_016866 [Tegillarca granosa]|uniref:UBC core domain-containing protein n=1 Tax=Tegillarca granosa TaxID=220873 RepID=A0ABQ9EM71_TEGGR|nr:hypothetical protein KUTeg_016866 [Tegillarca granosa]
MFSRAHLLIEREYERLLEDVPWIALKGGVFRVYLKFDEHYNVRPPEVCFHTIPFHPNVDMITGRPCIEFLDDFSQWKETYSLSFILISIQNLLSSPVLQNPVNPEAAEMLIHSPRAYKQMVYDCVTASQRVEAGVTPHGDLESRVKFVPQEEMPKRYDAPKTAAPRVTRMSFEDYHKTWCGIATSKPIQDMKNPCKHTALMYGRFQHKQTEEEERAEKLAKLNRMKKIYLPPRISPSPSGQYQTGYKVNEEPWEKEVDDLVAWSSNLDAGNIEV